MVIKYHQSALMLLGVVPRISQVNVGLVSAFEEEHNLQLPSAIREWYSLEGHIEIFEKIVEPHEVVRMNTSSEIQDAYGYSLNVSEPFLLVLENQAVWYLAVKLTEGENPPIYVRYNERDEAWKLHAESFSNWIYALCWDYAFVTHSKNRRFSLKSEANLTGFSVDAPETYEVQIHLKGKKFERMRKNDEYLLVVD